MEAASWRAWRAAYTYGALGLVSERLNPDGQLGTAQSLWYHTNFIGSVNAVTNDQWQTVETYDYDAYGVPLMASGNTPNRFRYVGQLGYYKDPDHAPSPKRGVEAGRAESGLWRASHLMLLGARYYDPFLGRFITQDPIGYAGGVNLYAYVANDPVNWADPEGLRRKRERPRPRFVQLAASGIGYAYGCKLAGHHWGTPGLVDCIKRVGIFWEVLRHLDPSPRPPIGVGDMSLRSGGAMPEHDSHRVGKDVDIRPVLSGGRTGPATWKDKAYSSVLTQQLVALFWLLCDVQIVWFNDPQFVLRGDKKKPLQPMPLGAVPLTDHDNHFHVRIH